MVLDYSSFTCVGLCRDVVCIVFGNQTEQSGVARAEGRGRKKRRDEYEDEYEAEVRTRSKREREAQAMQRISARNVRNAAGRSFWKILTVGKNIALHFATAWDRQRKGRKHV